MSDEQIKLIVKIQHFYDLLCNLKEDYIKDTLAFPDKNIERSYVIKEYDDLVEKYEGVFDSILYLEE